ncbi:putative membrane protein [Blastococcus colisei]|uniref:Putative membrane protein n=1 Tax=Blastococcus colisei TaxID=1564162 RepID=A0A543PFA8_9ACTN|nr:DUF2254 domain-containing protein [Blastococcus colisei]TQN42747.1 putative membrane protein [Blastococcus colisei]
MPGNAWAAVRARVRGSLWPIPVLGIVVAVGLGVALPALDEMLASRPDGHPLALAFGGGPSAARDLLAAIAGSLISVTGLTFSFTVVALQLASSQHSPRLLQTFVTDRVVQLTLAQLVATFVYALTVLRTVRTESATNDESAFVPRLSVTVAFALTLVSVVAIVLFLAHLARSLRVETMYRDVHDEATETYARELPAQDDQDDEPGVDLPAGSGRPLTARSSGFVVDADHRAIVAAATEVGVTVLLGARIGDSVVAGTPLASVWPADTDADLEPLEDALHDGVRLGFERSPTRDIAYSLRKVVDIAVRALSPGTNDPTTAVHGLSHVSALLVELVARPPRPSAFRDDDGVLRLIVPQWDVASLMRLGLEEPIQFASGQPAVLRRIAGLLREVAWRAPRGVLDHDIEGYLRQVVDLSRESTAVSDAEIESWEQWVSDALAGRWVPARPEGSIVRG